MAAKRLSGTADMKRPPAGQSTADAWETIAKDLEGLYRLQCMQLTLIRNLQKEIERLSRSS